MRAQVSTVLLVFIAAIPAAADSYPVILQGKVVTQDGDPPSTAVAIERICSDDFGSTSGPLTNKKGEYLWRMDIDPQKTRSCFLRASHAGYVSTNIDISALTGVNGIVNLPPIIVTSQASNPYAIVTGEAAVPGKAKKAWDKAMKDLSASNREDAAAQLQEVVQTAPKFAVGWHALGVTDEGIHKQSEARDAYTHAVAADPKFLPPYVTLIRLCVKEKDWQCVSQNSDSLIAADKKHTFDEVYLHRAAARFELKDLNGAESDAEEAIQLDTHHRHPRAEYVLARILQAKGNADAAREHLAKFLELDSNAADAAQMKLYMEKLGVPGDVPEPPPLDPL